MTDREPSTDEPTSEGADDDHNAEQTAEVRGGFLGFVAHEIRNPLSTALWSAELLTRLAPEERGGARGEKLSGMCLRALQRMRLLVEDHFLAERLAIGGLPVRCESVALREVVDAVASKSGAEVTAEVDDLQAWGDRGLLERAVDAVIAAASRGKTPVHVVGTSARGVALLRVHGAPIPTDALATPRKGTASDPAGRALSLLAASRIARALGGTLTASGDDYILGVPLDPPPSAAAP